MQENKNSEPSSREWNGKQRIRRAMVALLFCLGPHCFGPEGTSTGNGDPNTSQIPVETVVNTSEKSITPPLQKNFDNKRISSPQAVQQIAQKFIQEVVDTIQTNQYNPDPVIEQCFKRLGLIAIGDAKDPYCRDYKVSFKISQEYLEKYPGLEKYYNPKNKEITIQMKELLNILCTGEDPYIYMEDSNNVNEIIKSIIANGMLKKYPNDIAMGVNWSLLLYTSTLTQHDILKIDMNCLPQLYFFDLVRDYCEKNLTVDAYFIEQCFKKIDISTLTIEDKKELLEKYALMFAGGEQWDGKFTGGQQWNGKFVEVFEKFFQKIFPKSDYFKGEITENIRETLGISSTCNLGSYIQSLINSMNSEQESDKEKYEQELRRILRIRCKLTKTISYEDAKQGLK